MNRLPHIAVLSLLCIAGCGGQPSVKEKTAVKKPKTSVDSKTVATEDVQIPREQSGPSASSSDAKSVDDYIASWAKMGMWLPDHKQIRFFDDHFETSHGALSIALSHPDDSVRMRVAYVIGEIGVRAKAAGPDLLARLKNEPDKLVRIYIINALNTIGFDSDLTISILKERFESLDSTNVPLNADNSYAEVDEKITIAAALFSLSGNDTNEEYLTFVTGWLNPPPKDLNDSLIEGYWQRRLMAVNSLESMPGAVEAIPLLESLLDEPKTKPWVSVHVPRVLTALRDNRER